MSMLDPLPLKEVLPIMGEALGLKVSEDRPEILRHVNKYRALLYSKYNDFALFNDVFHTICVHDFGCYQGFTLPPDVVSVEAVWDYGRSLTLHSRWREAHTGLGINGCERVSAIEMAETFPTERDMLKPSSLKLFTSNEEDDGKCVHVDILNMQGNKVTRIFKLISDGWAVDSVKAKKILSVSLPDDRTGSVTIAQRDGFELSRYAPWETIPNYRRFKVASHCCKGVVLVQGIKKFRPIFFDHEIVEVGNELVIEAAGKKFKFGDNTADGNEIAVADRWMMEMKNLLNGLIARHRGNAIQDGSVPFRKPIRKKSLPGYR